MLFCMLLVYLIWFCGICLAKRMTIDLYINIRDMCIFPRLFYNILTSSKGQNVIELLLKSEKYFDCKIMIYMLGMFIVLSVNEFYQIMLVAVGANIILCFLIYGFGRVTKRRCCLNSLIINSAPLLAMIAVITNATLLALDNIIQDNGQNNLIIVFLLAINMTVALAIGITWCWQFIDYCFILGKNKKKIVYIFMMALHMTMVMVGFGSVDIVCDKEYRTQVVKKISNDSIAGWTIWVTSHSALPIINENENIKNLLDGKCDDVHAEIDSYMSNKGIFLVEAVFVALFFFVGTQMLSGV